MSAVDKQIVFSLALQAGIRILVQSSCDDASGKERCRAYLASVKRNVAEESGGGGHLLGASERTLNRGRAVTGWPHGMRIGVISSPPGLTRVVCGALRTYNSPAARDSPAAQVWHGDQRLWKSVLESCMCVTRKTT